MSNEKPSAPNPSSNPTQAPPSSSPTLHEKQLSKSETQPKGPPKDDDVKHPDPKNPPGGHDSTSLRASSEPTYTIRITFHRATNIPMADIGDGSADPYLLAQLNTSHTTRHAEDPPLRYRSRTIQRTKEPEWNSQWVVAGVPQSGFTLKVRIYDEDPDDHDDRLGDVQVASGRIDESWGIKEESYKASGRGSSMRAYGFRWCTKMTHRRQKIHPRLILSVKVLGRTKDECGKAYTMNSFWRCHCSPMIGRLAGTKDDNKGVEKFE